MPQSPGVQRRGGSTPADTPSMVPLSQRIRHGVLCSVLPVNESEQIRLSSVASMAARLRLGIFHETAAYVPVS